MPEKTAQKEPGKKPSTSKKLKPPQEVVVQIPLSELHPFPDHPFQVREDASMQETAESVKNTASSSPRWRGHGRTAAILPMVHSPPAFERGTSPKSRVLRRRCRKECISS